MKDSGKAIMGSAMAEGENRAIKAVEDALSSPLLNDDNISGADNILLYIASGKEEISMDEVIEITDYIQTEAGENADIIWGNGTDESLENYISITLIATGFKSRTDQIQEKNRNKKVHILTDEAEITEKEEKVVKEKIENIELIRNKEIIEKVETKETISNTNFNINDSESEKENTFTFDFTNSLKNNKEEKNEVHESEVNFKTNSQNNIESSDNETIDFQGLQKTISPKKSFEEENVERKAIERINKLKTLSIKLKSSEGISQLENEPAYLRKKVIFDKNVSSDSEISRYSLSDDDEKKESSIKSNNSFLHDNVD